jgi:nicotianamine synthase
MNDSGSSPTSAVGSGRSRSDHIIAVPAPAPAAAVGAVVNELGNLCRELTGQSSLAPAPGVDRLFGRLVQLVVAMGAAEARMVLADARIRAIVPRLRQLCATGETELERAWARRIACSPDPSAELERFPYVENYRLLIRLEWSAVLGAAGAVLPTRIAFIGCGPLPLSPLLLARHHGVAVDAYDRDQQAVDQARAVVEAVPAPGLLRIHHGDTARCPDLRAYDVVVLAALVGVTAGAKRAVIRHVHDRMRPGALLAARSAHAARSLLYPVLDLESLAELELLSVVHPLNQVINSVVVARKRPGNTSPLATSPSAPNNEVRPWPVS